MALYRLAFSLHESCGFAAALHRRFRWLMGLYGERFPSFACPAGNWLTGASALRLQRKRLA